METTPVLSHKEVVEQMLKDLKAEVKFNLSMVGLMTTHQLVLTLLVYRNVVEPNFIKWMVDICLSCTDPKAVDAFAGNIDCELRQNHPKMLRDFVAQIPPSPTEQNNTCEVEAMFLTKQKIGYYIRRMNVLIEQKNSVDGLLIAAGLENASLEFIPWMVEAGKKLGFTDFTYTDVHGEADKEHAVDLTNAVVSQAQSLGITPSQLAKNDTLKEVGDMLKSIFLVVI